MAFNLSRVSQDYEAKGKRLEKLAVTWERSWALTPGRIKQAKAISSI